MHIDIVEAIRQKQQREPKSIIICNGKVVVRPGEPEEEDERTITDEERSS